MADGVVEVPLTKGYVALIDAEDAERILAHKWCACLCDGYVYAVRGTRIEGKGKRLVRMHRELAGAQGRILVDHINGNTLDNRKCNLRLVNDAQNGHNTRAHRDASSKFKGVSWERHTGKWAVYIRMNSKNTRVGSFGTEEEAARAYDAAAIKYQGEYARLNFPSSPEQPSALCV